MKREEERIHRACIHFLRTVLPPEWLVLHAANGGYRTPVESAMFKGLGVLPGYPDITIHGETVRGCNTWFCEVKSPKGRLSDAQRECHERLRNLGFAVAIIHSLDEAERAARAWGLPLKGGLA